MSFCCRREVFVFFSHMGLIGSGELMLEAKDFSRLEGLCLLATVLYASVSEERRELRVWIRVSGLVEGDTFLFGVHHGSICLRGWMRSEV